MKLNPLEIYNKEFNKSTFGYNKSQVDDFIEDIGVAYERLLKDINNLQEENKKLKEKIEHYQKMEDRLNNTLDTMQDTIADRVEQAENEAQVIIKEAKVEADKIKEKAKAEVAAEKRKVEELREQKNFFKIRFQTLLQSHLEMLQDDKEEGLRREITELENEYEQADEE
ncbi:DivIVA domain-containing protein [Halanaerobium sp. Z-7514]|uniref:DivIVA domain-containing protein n=1 Tax=Halanaerobium polyolivorans TaxID=2886943 RepID=A0AAW4WZH5_9FIRM|nr:DivIVA domain-containing protein [Halanaerobium polyolivorans]MCC3144757.1 DivIVA domain-containing protein [Halanaerobium polyolivorans]